MRKLENIGRKLAGCRQIVNGIDLGLEYEKLYKEYSRLYDMKSFPARTHDPRLEVAVEALELALILPEGHKNWAIVSEALAKIKGEENGN